MIDIYPTILEAISVESARCLCFLRCSAKSLRGLQHGVFVADPGINQRPFDKSSELVRLWAPWPTLGLRKPCAQFACLRRNRYKFVQYLLSFILPFLPRLNAGLGSSSAFVTSLPTCAFFIFQVYSDCVGNKSSRNFVD